MKATILLALSIASSMAAAQTKPATSSKPEPAACAFYARALDGSLKQLASLNINFGARSAVQASQLELEKLNARQTMAVHLQHMAMLGCAAPTDPLDEAEYFSAAVACYTAKSADAPACDRATWKRSSREAKN